MFGFGKNKSQSVVSQLIDQRALIKDKYERGKIDWLASLPPDLVELRLELEQSYNAEAGQHNRQVLREINNPSSNLFLPYANTASLAVVRSVDKTMRELKDVLDDDDTWPTPESVGASVVTVCNGEVYANQP